MSIEKRVIISKNESSQVQKIVSSFQQYSSKLSFKHAQLIDHILQCRKAAVSLISTQYKRKYLPINFSPIVRQLWHKSTEDAKKKELINSILKQRQSASNRIINWFKKQLYQRKVKDVRLKREKCYTIESSIAESKEFYLQIIGERGQSKKYKAEKCPLLGIVAFYIPRSDIHSLIVKVHFIANGVTILDPKFGTGSDDEFNFFNLINFTKIIKAENDEKEENKKFISSICSTASSSFGFKALKSISSSDLKSLNYGLSKYNKKFQSMAYLGIQVKSILKQRPAKRVTSSKRIAFGEVDYSY